MPRLGHKKSKRGCFRCKQRRVKCDENDPCSACVRHGVQCVFADGVAIDPGTRSSSFTSIGSEKSGLAFKPRSPDFSLQGNARPSPDPGLHASSSMGSVAEADSSTVDTFPLFAKFVTNDAFVESEWVKDLELMHHYTYSTYLTLPRAIDIRQLWQVDVPRLAMSNNFLMHQLLATSAYHMAYLTPSPNSYRICASIHQNKAIFGLRSALSQISETNCTEVFAASTLLCVSGFASYSSQNIGSERPEFEALLDVLTLIRGMSFILDSYERTLFHGPLGALFQNHDQNPPAPPILVTLIGQLGHLASLFTNSDANSSVCREAIESTISWADKIIQSTHWQDLRFTLSWPICLSEDFIDLLRQSDPMALAILAHYSVILHHTGKMHWYLSGWGKRVLEGIGNIMDQSWTEAIQWPLKMI